MDSYITWPYLIADHCCRITWVYNKCIYHILVIREGQRNEAGLRFSCLSSRKKALKSIKQSTITSVSLKLTDMYQHIIYQEQYKVPYKEIAKYGT